MSSPCALWDEAAVLEQPCTALVQGGSSLNRDVQPEQPGKAERQGNTMISQNWRL